MKKAIVLLQRLLFVRAGRVELPHHSALDPKSNVSTNSTTPAFQYVRSKITTEIHLIVFHCEGKYTPRFVICKEINKNIMFFLKTVLDSPLVYLISISNIFLRIFCKVSRRPL